MRRILKSPTKQRGAALAEYGVVLCCVVLVATMGVVNFSLTFRENVLCVGTLRPMIEEIHSGVLWSVNWEGSLGQCWGVVDELGLGITTDVLLG